MSVYFGVEYTTNKYGRVMFSAYQLEITNTFYFAIFIAQFL